MSDSMVNIEIEENIAVITMDDGKANAFSMAMLDQLESALDQAQKENCVVVITGRPGRLSAGFDLSVMSQGGDAVIALVKRGAEFSRRLLAHPTPVILACSGHAMAMGALLTLSCDYRVGVAGNYKLGLNEVAIGMTMPWFGVHLAAGKLASDYLDRAVTNAEIFSPETAVAAGYLDQIVAEDQLLDTAKAIAKEMGALNMTAHAATKLRVREPLLKAVDDSIRAEFGG